MTRYWLLLSAVACVAGLSGCSSTGGETSGAFALALPDTVSVTPHSFASEAEGSTGVADVGTTTVALVDAAGLSSEPVADSVTAVEVASTAKGDRLAARKGDRLAVAPVTPEADQKPVIVPAVATSTEQSSVMVASAFAAPQKPALAAVEGLAQQDRPATTGRGHLDELIAKYAAAYSVPVDLVHKVVRRESNYRPEAYSRGNWGLMQIRHATAKGMGYSGPAKGLLDAETNLKYAVKYLRGAYLVANGDHARADRLYQTGYYYHAKRAGLLAETGLGKDRKRRRN